MQLSAFLFVVEFSQNQFEFPQTQLDFIADGDQE
jgi:hypothetical protein